MIICSSGAVVSTIYGVVWCTVVTSEPPYAALLTACVHVVLYYVCTSMYVCVCMCVYVCMYVRMYVCMYVYIHTYIHI